MSGRLGVQRRPVPERSGSASVWRSRARSGGFPPPPHRIHAARPVPSRQRGPDGGTRDAPAAGSIRGRVRPARRTRPAGARSWKPPAVGSTALGAKRRQEADRADYLVSAARAGMRYVPVMARGRFDVVDAWLFPSYGLEGVVHPFTGVPVFVAGRRSLSGYKQRFGPFRTALDAVARWQADAIVANAYAVRDDVLRRERVRPALIRVIHNGVEIPPPMPAAERARIRASWGVGEGELLVGAVANLKAGKGHDILIDVAAATRDALPEARFRIVGGGLGARQPGARHRGPRPRRPIPAARSGPGGSHPARRVRYRRPSLRGGRAAERGARGGGRGPCHRRDRCRRDGRDRRGRDVRDPDPGRAR